MKMEKNSILLSKVMRAKIWLFLNNILLMESKILQDGFYFDTIFGGDIDVSDGCWRPNVLVTSLRCC